MDVILLYLQQFNLYLKMDQDEQIKRHHQKWNKWNNQLKKTDQKPPSKKIQPDQSPYNYAVKLIQKLNDSDDYSKQKKSMADVEDELESNACYVCMELMVPPKKPIILFPCSHNICKLCLFEDGESRKKQYKLKLLKCPICKQNISNHAENRNLMTLICTYTDNKHLLQKQLKMEEQDKLNAEEEEKQASQEQIQKIRIRCSILDHQRISLDFQLTKEQKTLKIFQLAATKLEEEKARNQKDLEALRKQSKLITQFLNDKEKELSRIQNQIQATDQKKKIAEKTLQPLRIQRQKMEVLEAAKSLGT